MRKLITIFFLLSVFLVKAQINESDTVKFQIRTSFTGNFQKGNVEILTLKSKLEFTLVPVKNWVFKSQNSGLYQEFSENKADNDIFSRNYLYFKPNKKLYPFIISYLSSNFRRKIDSRYFIGAGLTYQIINNNKNVLKFSASTIYENTQYKTTSYNFEEYNDNDRISLWRGTVYLGGWNYILEKKIRVYYDAFYQPAFNNNNNYRTQADVGFDFPLWKGLSFNTLYTITHENVTPIKIKKDDKILTFGFAYNFKSTSKNK